MISQDFSYTFKSFLLPVPNSITIHKKHRNFSVVSRISMFLNLGYFKTCGLQLPKYLSQHVCTSYYSSTDLS